MKNESYRITSPTLGILSEDGSRIPITLPLNAVVTIVDGPLDGNRMVEVVWEGTKLLMFTQDVRERATRVWTQTETQL